MVELANVTNLHVENITLQNSVGWTLRPIGCKNVLIRKVTIRNPINASNCDGIDPQACEDLLIDGCDIVTGDDAICVKSGNFYGGNQLSRNISITNCRVSTCTNGLTVGTEASKPFQNISFSNCVVYAVDGPINQRPYLRSLRRDDGWHPSIDGVTFNNIEMINVRTPIFVRLQVSAGSLKYSQTTNTPLKGSIQNVSFSNIQATGATPHLVDYRAGHARSRKHNAQQHLHRDRRAWKPDLHPTSGEGSDGELYGGEHVWPGFLLMASMRAMCRDLRCGM